jgi:hypothetical protein
VKRIFAVDVGVLHAGDLKSCNPGAGLEKEFDVFDAFISTLRRLIITMQPQAVRLQTGQPKSACRTLPGRELFRTERIAFAGFVETENAAVHRRNDLSLVAGNPPAR